MCYLILVYNGWLITINKFSNLLRCTYMVNVFLQIHLWARVVQRVRSLDLTTHTSLSPIRRGFVPSFVNYKKGCTRLAAASDKVYQLLAHGRWFSPASSTTKTGRHDIAESGAKTPKIKSIRLFYTWG